MTIWNLTSLSDNPVVSTQVKLGILDYALHTLNQIQRKWVYLEPIFGMGALPAEQGRFRRVEEEFRDIMSKVSYAVLGIRPKWRENERTVRVVLIYPEKPGASVGWPWYSLCLVVFAGFYCGPHIDNALLNRKLINGTRAVSKNDSTLRSAFGVNPLLTPN